MKLDLRPLLAGDRLLEFNYELPLDTENADLCTILSDVRFPSPMKVTGDITNTAGYMRMKLTFTVDYQTQCARCLSSIDGTFTRSLEKTVAPKDLIADLNEYRLDDYAIIEDGFLDMDKHLIEELEVEFPMRHLCRKDCRGLCQRCGKNLNEQSCECGKDEIDPRLEPLRKILEQMKKENK